MRRTSILAATILFLPLAAWAQGNQPSHGRHTVEEPESELSVQGNGFFTKDVNGTGTTYSATQTGGVLGTYRRHLKPQLSVELAYGFDRNTQKYQVASQGFRIQTYIHQVTAAFVLNMTPRMQGKLNPYLLIGGGGLLFAPTGSQQNFISGAAHQTKGAFMYGGGINYAISRKFEFRAEYRGLIYGTADFGFGSLVTNAVTHTAVPSIGIAYKF